jgi:uncharacterized membrane protein
MIKRIIYAIAGMSQKASIVYCWLLTFFFLIGLGSILTGLFFLNPDGDQPAFAIPIIIVGSVVSFIVVATIACTTIASNYVRRNPKQK